MKTTLKQFEQNRVYIHTVWQQTDVLALHNLTVDWISYLKTAGQVEPRTRKLQTCCNLETEKCHSGVLAFLQLKLSQCHDPKLR